MIVYTAIMGKLEKLYDPLKPDRSKDQYICFTDQKIRSRNWEIRPAVYRHEDGRLAARQHKVHPHVLFPGAEDSIWMDANMQLTVDPEVVRIKARGFELVGLVHPKNDSVEQEAAQIHASLKIPLELLCWMIANYRADGFVPPSLVTSTGFLYRKHTPAMRQFHEIWWKEILVCIRDQMSVDYSAWKAGVQMRHFAGHFRNCDFFRYFTHEGKETKILARNLTLKNGRTFLT